MSRFVFFSADEGRIEVDIDGVVIGHADNAVTLATLLRDNGVNLQDDLAKSSSIDFCEECGFEEGAAESIIGDALANLYLWEKTAKSA